MKEHMLTLWQPGKGVSIKEEKQEFSFSNSIIKWIWNGCSTIALGFPITTYWYGVEFNRGRFLAKCFYFGFLFGFRCMKFQLIL